jgi:GntR family transcriptional regulator, trigonelline degradation regulator
MSSMAVTRHPPIRDQIASILRNAIVNLDFQPGQLLVERELCEITGASRPSVREALRQLEAEGLVESRNGRGTMVRVLGVDEVHDLYDVRAELEGLAARRFAERASDDERARLAAALTDLATATASGSSAAILAAQGAFYAALFAGARNPLLNQMVQGLQVRVAQLRALTLTVPGRAEASGAEFGQIGAALAASDAEAAYRAAVEHVRAAGEVMAHVAEERRDA